MNRSITAEQRIAIMLVIRDHKGDQWLTTAEIADALDLDDRVVYRRLKALSKAGKVYHSRHHKRNSMGRRCTYFRWQLSPDVRRNLEYNVQ